jgi:hypothetical protein
VTHITKVCVKVIPTPEGRVINMSYDLFFSYRRMTSTVPGPCWNKLQQSIDHRI